MSLSFMYSPKSRVRFWEQEGQRWNALQLKGRKYSSLHFGFVHLILARPLVVSYYASLELPLAIWSNRSGCAL